MSTSSRASKSPPNSASNRPGASSRARQVPWPEPPRSRRAAKTTQVLGNPDLPHTFTYLGDFARGLVTLGTRDEALGEVWHVPSADTLSTREFARLVFEAAGQQPKLSVMPSALLAVLALFSPMLRAVREQQYQRETPWVVDHSKFARAFGAEVTPHREAITATLDWYRSDRP